MTINTWEAVNTWDSGVGAPAVISAVTSSNGASTATALGLLTITVDSSVGVTSVTINGVNGTSVLTPNATTVTCVCPKGFLADYGSIVDVIVNNGAASIGFPVTTFVPSGTVETDFTVAFAGLNVNSPFSGNPAYSSIAIGDSCVYESITTPDNHPVSMSGDGVFTLTGDVIAIQTFDIFIFDNSDKTTGTTATITVNPVFLGVGQAGVGAGTGLVGSVTLDFIDTSGSVAASAGSGLAGSGSFDWSSSGLNGTSIGSGLGGSLKSDFIDSGLSGAGVGTGLTGSITTSATNSFNGVGLTGLGAGTGLAGTGAFDWSSTGSNGIGVGTGLPGSLTITSGSFLGIGQPGTSIGSGLTGSFAGSVSLTDLQNQIAALQGFVDELYIRLDLNPLFPNTYADDASSITNADFTLTKQDNGNGTFDIIRTTTP